MWADNTCAALLCSFVIAATIFPAVVGSMVGPAFTREPPSRMDLANSTGAVLECAATGSPPPVISWLTADGKPVLAASAVDSQSGSNSAVLRQLSNGSLHLLPFSADAYRREIHDATYRCKASNAAGAIVSRDVRLHAVVLQHFSIQVVYNRNVIRGNTAVLKCGISLVAREFVSVTAWLQDDAFHIYPSLKGDGKFHMLPTGELLIRRVEDADKYRSYQCRAVNRLNGVSVLSSDRAGFTVTDSRVATPPRPLDRTAIVSVRKDQSVILSCFAEGNPPPTYRWYRADDGEELRAVVEDSRVSASDELLIVQHAEEGDAGLWVCMANNSAGGERVDVTLRILAPLSVAIRPPGPVTADVGARLELQCSVTGGGGTGAPPVVSWLKDGEATGNTGNLLSIGPVRREEVGMYQCIARTNEDSAQASVQLVLGAAQPQLVYKFIQQILQPGPSVSLKCIATGNPLPYITWLLDGFPLPTNERFLIGQFMTVHGRDVVSHVNISNVMVEDGGIYECTATNKVGQVRHSAELRVYGPPYVRPMPNKSAVAGVPLYVACPAGGYPLESITWEKDGRLLPINRRQRVFANNGTLFLNNVQRDADQGTYRCTATNKQGASSTQTVVIDVIVPPQITPFAFQRDLHVGDRAGVQCFVSKGDLPLTVDWLKDGQPLADSDVSVKRHSEYVSALHVDGLRADHAGTYSCVASNAAATVSHSSQLLVNVPPRIGPFSFGELVEGVRTQVQCAIQAGDPPLTLSWTRDGQPLEESADVRISHDAYSSTLVIARVSRQHSGNYTCSATNEASSSSLTAPLVVSGQQAVEYQDLNRRSRGVQLLPNGTFVIKAALPELQGQYMCEASNGVGAGVSAVVTLGVRLPPDIELKSSQAMVRRGSPQVLECQALGDMPITITWQREPMQPPLHPNLRYEVRERPIRGGLTSEIHISTTVNSDSGGYTCVASNPYGRAERTIRLQVQDAPGRPLELRVVDTTSRQIRLTWVPPPSEERSSALEYSVQISPAGGNSGLSDQWRQIPTGSELRATIGDLSPATMYRVRVVAENELGAGDPSEALSVRTDGEPPAGEPTNLKVTATAADTIDATWDAPPRSLWHGDLLGYYVGIRELGTGRAPGFNFSTVLTGADGSGRAHLTNLNKFRKYGIVVQAFNEKGPGPMHSEQIVQTLEDAPGAPPMEVFCKAISSQSILVTWQPPPILKQNGVLLGYRVSYENDEEWPPGYIESDIRTTSDLKAEIHGLQKYANYSVRVGAFTRIGEGPRSTAIHCLTDEDVPEAPADIKVSMSGPASLLVSWLPPRRSHGRLTGYILYKRTVEGGREPEKQQLPAHKTQFEATDLRVGLVYEFWATATTQAGEGKRTATARGTANGATSIPAAIASFGHRVLVRRRGSVTLPCVLVGQPQPKRQWLGRDGTPVVSNEHLSVESNGSLVLVEVQRRQSGNYTCVSTNKVGGDDRITYSVKVLVAPTAPNLMVAATGVSSLQLTWSVTDSGGAAIRAFVLNFRTESGEWEERTLPRDAVTYRLEGLECGTAYRLQLTAINSVGAGPASPPLQTRTEGGPPGQPSSRDIVAHNGTTAMLMLRNWPDGGCPITGFSIDYRERDTAVTSTQWSTIGNRTGADTLLLSTLWPGSRYVVRVRVSNAAGTTMSELEIVPPPPPYLAGGTLRPGEAGETEDALVVSANETLVVYGGAAILVAVTLGVILGALCLRRRNMSHRLSTPVSAASTALPSTPGDQTLMAMDNKHNLAQREQFYAAVQKGASTPERIPEYAEDISPYATFHVASQQPGPYLYHDQRLAAMETLQLKSGNTRDYTKLRQTKPKSDRDSDRESREYHKRERDRERIHMHALLYSGGGSGASAGAAPESSTSPEPSPVPQRRRRHQHIPSSHRNGPFPLEPPTGFSDNLELSEAECDRDTLRRAKKRMTPSSGTPGRGRRNPLAHPGHFTIAV